MHCDSLINDFGIRNTGRTLDVAQPRASAPSDSHLEFRNLKELLKTISAPIRNEVDYLPVTENGFPGTFVVTLYPEISDFVSAF
jgi:hypothetical protein